MEKHKMSRAESARKAAAARWGERGRTSRIRILPAAAFALDEHARGRDKVLVASALILAGIDSERAAGIRPE